MTVTPEEVLQSNAAFAYVEAKAEETKIDRYLKTQAPNYSDEWWYDVHDQHYEVRELLRRTYADLGWNVRISAHQLDHAALVFKKPEAPVSFGMFDIEVIARLLEDYPKPDDVMELDDFAEEASLYLKCMARQFEAAVREVELLSNSRDIAETGRKALERAVRDQHKEVEDLQAALKVATGDYVRERDLRLRAESERDSLAAQRDHYRGVAEVRWDELERLRAEVDSLNVLLAEDDAPTAELPPVGAPESAVRLPVGTEVAVIRGYHKGRTGTVYEYGTGVTLPAIVHVKVGERVDVGAIDASPCVVLLCVWSDDIRAVIRPDETMLSRLVVDADGGDEHREPDGPLVPARFKLGDTVTWGTKLYSYPVLEVLDDRVLVGLGFNNDVYTLLFSAHPELELVVDVDEDCHAGIDGGCGCRACDPYRYVDKWRFVAAPEAEPEAPPPLDLRRHLREACTTWLGYYTGAHLRFRHLVANAIEAGMPWAALQETFEVARSTGERWITGRAVPHPLIKIRVVQFILAWAGCAHAEVEPGDNTGSFDAYTTERCVDCLMWRMSGHVDGTRHVGQWCPAAEYEAAVAPRGER